MFERIRDLRNDKDLSQKTFAEILNVAQTTYSDYELGKVNIPLNTLVKIALYYNVSTDYLLNLTDESLPYPKTKNK